jgi:hypothetical protein
MKKEIATTILGNITELKHTRNLLTQWPTKPLMHQIAQFLTDITYEDNKLVMEHITEYAYSSSDPLVLFADHSLILDGKSLVILSWTWFVPLPSLEEKSMGGRKTFLGIWGYFPFSELPHNLRSLEHQTWMCATATALSAAGADFEKGVNAQANIANLVESVSLW